MFLIRALVGAGLLAGLSVSVRAQTIYPLDRAEILLGSKFDFKVEVPGEPEQSAVKITINGQPAAEFLGRTGSYLVKEDGKDHSAFWVRDAVLTAPGALVVEASVGDKTAKVTWTVFDTPAERRAKNVILFIGDGMSIAHRTAARMLSKGIKEGKYGGELAIDDMPHMALVSTAGTDSIVTDSANSAASYTTGHKSCNNALGVYCARNASSLDHPKVETIAELVRRGPKMAVGIVTNTELEDATPASMVSHTRRRGDYNEIVGMMHALQPDVAMGGGARNFWPKSKAGSRREDEIDYVAKFTADGYTVVSTATELKAAAGAKKLLGLFNTGNMDGALDRRILKKGSVPKFPDQPDLVDQTKAALAILEKSETGFLLMVESGLIDKYTHILDWERAVYDTIMLDNAVQAAKDWAGTRNDTLIIVVPDHAHPVSIAGGYDDERTGQLLRDKFGVYSASKFPNYPPPDAEGYPPSVDVSRRIAFTFGAYPDHCDTGHPHLDNPNAPTVDAPDGKTKIANEANCTRPGAARRTGNLPFEVGLGVHSGDDVILTATGPGAELFRGRIDNTRVFRIMATALALGAVVKP